MIELNADERELILRIITMDGLAVTLPKARILVEIEKKLIASLPPTGNPAPPAVG